MGELNGEGESFIEKFPKIIITKKLPVINDVKETKTENEIEVKLDLEENNKNEKSVRKNKKKRKENYILQIVDALLTTVIICPLVVGTWRGLWNLMDYYEFPNGWICFITGTSLHWIFTILRENFHKEFVITWRNSNPIGRGGYRAVRLIYIWLFCVACNLQWRGGWSLFDSLISDDSRITGGIVCTMILILMCLESSRNLIAPPFIVVVDYPNYIFRFPTRFQKQEKLAMNFAETRPLELNQHEQNQQQEQQNWRMVELRSGAGIDRPTTRRFHYLILTILDAIFSAFVAAPAVVGYWRGTWGLSDIYIYPKDSILSTITSIVIGYGGLLFFNILQHPLNNLLNPDKHRLSYYIGSRVYTAIYGFCCVNAWRGGWQILYIFTQQNPNTVIATTTIALIALVIIKGVKNISAPPFSLSLDSHPGYFEVPTMFRINNNQDWTLYILDCAFSVGIVGSLVIFVWRGVWVLIDLYLYPNDREYSSICSMIIGYIIVAVTFCLQPWMRYACSRLQGIPRLLAADVFLLLSFLGTINVWRGIWSLLDLWFLPEDVELSCWITHIGCFIFLGLLNCSNSILVRGVYIDAEEEEGKCVVFPCHYLRLFFKMEREKKKTRRRNLLALSRQYSCNDGNGKDVENGVLLNCNLPTIIPSREDNIQG